MYESIQFPVIRNPAPNIYADWKPDPQAAFELLVDTMIEVVKEFGSDPGGMRDRS